VRRPVFWAAQLWACCAGEAMGMRPAPLLAF
jgi:hypothetical protein